MAPTADPLAPLPPRPQFWGDGFTVEDLSEEEEAAAAAAKAPPAPRRTGVVGLSESRGADAPMPKVPTLRKYEDNKTFMEELKAGIPPAEFRELDISSGVPRPRPVDIMLGDMRPQPFPADLARRATAMGGARESAKPKPAVAAFSGAGHTLAGPSSDGGAQDAPAPAPLGAWPSADRASPTVDEAAPTTEVQVRLAGHAPARVRLNRAHTVADLKHAVDVKLQAAGEAPRAYVLSAGFPPKPLVDDSATLEAAGLISAAVTHRWA